ncbi:MAG TPA: hypothetical protein PK668_26910 [Myxococcota bacterium]|nr:hypothetical protein [Myxococcota bacterium]HRY97159.1 hypothetical protein [Myxococcota bacterium]
MSRRFSSMVLALLAVPGLSVPAGAEECFPAYAEIRDEFNKDPFLTKALMPEVADQLPRTLLQFLPWESSSVRVGVELAPARKIHGEAPAECEATHPRQEDWNDACEVRVRAFNPASRVAGPVVRRLPVPRMGRANHLPEDIFFSTGPALNPNSPSYYNAVGKTVEWDGRNDRGLPVPEGFYLFEVRCVLPVSLQPVEAGKTPPGSDLQNVRVGRSSALIHTMVARTDEEKAEEESHRVMDCLVRGDRAGMVEHAEKSQRLSPGSCDKARILLSVYVNGGSQEKAEKFLEECKRLGLKCKPELRLIPPPPSTIPPPPSPTCGSNR